MPDWKQYVRDNLPPLGLGPERELEMAYEMAQHLEAVYEDALENGESELEAFKRAQAHIRDWHVLESELIRSKRPIAAPLITNRLARDARIHSKSSIGGILMGSFAQDLRYGVRMLLKNKTLTTIAALSLGLGIGASTAIFSLIDAVLLKTLPVKNPHELVLFDWLSGPKYMAGSIDGHLGKDEATGLSTSTSFSYATFNNLRENAQTLSDVFAFTQLDQLNVNVDGQAEMASGQLVSGGYYDGLGLPAALGRTIGADDDQPAANAVAVISHRYWQRRFGQDPTAIGKSIAINGAPFTIIGVTPRGFEGTLEVGSSPDFSIPIAMEPRVNLGRSLLNDHGSWWLHGQ